MVGWVLCLAFWVSLVVDYYQTLVFLREGRELNGVLVWLDGVGMWVGWWFVLWGVLGLVVVWVGLGEWGVGILGVLVGSEVHCVWRNCKVRG